jgi:phytoene dehydrogenase-like protein
MGSISRELARLAREAGAELRAGAKVESILLSGGRAEGVRLASGEELRAKVVVGNVDPFNLRNLVGAQNFPADFNRKLDGLLRNGTTMKVNFALAELPKFKCLPERRGQHNATIHLLPQVEKPIEHIRRGYEEVQAGRLADFPTIEWYIHTEADPSLKDAEGRHNSAFFVQWVPYALAGKSWDAEEPRYVQHLIDIAEEFAPGFKNSVVDVYTLTPPKIEAQLGITRGHIHHVDNTFAMTERMPYRTPIDGLYSCSAGCHPAGSVVGAAGHNAARRILRDLGLEKA